MRGKPKARKGQDLLSWRSRQKTGAIMQPSTFEGIKKSEMEKGLSEERATKAAGSQYWKTARAKYKKSKGGK
jgi:hypothetical protein